MYNINQYRTKSRNKTDGFHLRKVSFQLGIVLIMMLILILVKYTKNQIGTVVSEKIRGVFYTDYTENTKSVIKNAYPYINNYFNQSEEKDATAEAETFSMDYLPVSGQVTSQFGERTHPITNKEENHTGIDIAVPEGTEVKAVFDGTVEKVEDDEILGIVIVINHGNGFKSTYGHLSEVKVSEGDKVTKGNVIALTGGTGLSTGPHLHFELMLDNEPVNPEEYLKSISN
jgi:murein DD-endopeptidase MepM/ murein hydrolase activator NlpD